MLSSFVSRTGLVASAAVVLLGSGPAFAAEPPEAVDDYATVAVGGSVTVPVLANDTFGVGARVVPQVLADGAWTATVSDNQLVVTDSADGLQEFEVRYVLVDQVGESTASVWVTVESAPPIADDQKKPPASGTGWPPRLNTSRGWMRVWSHLHRGSVWERRGGDACACSLACPIHRCPREPAHQSANFGGGVVARIQHRRDERVLCRGGLGLLALKPAPRPGYLQALPCPLSD